jgi:hypothetical protein
MKISSARTITESLQLMSEGVHEAAHAVVARVLPAPFLHAEGYRVRSLKEIICESQGEGSHVLIDYRISLAGIRAAYRRGDARGKRRAVRQAYKNCIVLMAGHIADAMFRWPSWTVDEKFDRFWEQVAYCMTEMDWKEPKFGDPEIVTLYLVTVTFNEYGSLDEPRVNAIARGLYHIAHRAVERNWWCIKAVAGNSIYTDSLSAEAVNYLIDRLAIGSRRAGTNHPERRLVRRVPEVSRMS